jgi:glycosyltransferase involved in cell wall biosynthesis
MVLKTRRYADTVIVVDDGSSDDTREVAEAAGAVVVEHDRNHGKGCALNTGLREARALNPRAVVLIDGDGQHRPEEIPEIVAPVLRGEADVVAGSRYLEKASEVPLHRVWGHRALNTLTHLASGVYLSDSQNGFRAFAPRALDEITFSSNGFSVESEMQFLIGQCGLRVVEAPVTTSYFDPPKRSAVAQGVAVLNGVLRLVGQYRPLLFFGMPGMIILLGGILWGGWVVDIYRRAKELAVGYALISVLLAILGSLGLFAGIILHSVRALLQDMLRTVGD